MRVRECSWPPSLVVEWLCRQLEQRGIPGTLYAHTVLSLLHSHYCLHSAAHYTASEQGLVVVVGTPPATALLEHCASLLQDHNTHQCSACRHTHANTHGAASDATTTPVELKQHDRPSRLLLGEAGLLKGALLLEEEEELLLGQNLHPDADLPLVPRNPKTPNKTKPQHKQACCCESSSRRARKRHKKLLQQELSLECFSPERLQKLTALQCLLSASDQEPSDLEALLEELCKRLKASTCLADADGAPPPSPPPPPPPHATRIADQVALLKLGPGAATGLQPSEQTASDAQRYFAAFPALPRDPESGLSTSSLSASPVADCVWGCKETCGHSEDTPTHSDDTPTHSDDTPTHGDDTLTHGDDTPTHGDDTLTHADDTPTHGDDTPTHGDDTPTHGDDTPTHGDDTPTHGDDTPTHGDDTLTHGDDTLTHGDDTPKHLHAATGNTAETKPLRANNNQVATSKEAATSLCDTKCIGIPPVPSNEVDSEPSSEVCSSSISSLQSSSCLIVSRDPLNTSFNEHQFSCYEKQINRNKSCSEGSEEIQNGETAKIVISADDRVNALDTSTSPSLSDSAGKSTEESCTDTPTVVGQAVGENLQLFSFSPSAEAVATPFASQLVELAADDEADNLALVTWNALEPSPNWPADVPIPLNNQLGAHQPRFKHLGASDPIELDLDLLVTTTGAPFKTRLSDAFTAPPTPCNLYSLGPISTEKKSVSPTHTLLDIERLTNFACDFNQTGALNNLSVLQNPDEPETPAKDRCGFSIWDSAFSPLVKLAVQTRSSHFKWKNNNVPENNKSSQTNDWHREKLIYSCAENTTDDNIASLRNTTTTTTTTQHHNFHISPSDLKRKQKLPYIAKHISPSDLKSKRKLPFSKTESLSFDVEYEDLMTYRFQDRIVSEQVESQLTAGHGMERSDQMSSVISGQQQGLISQPRYQSYDAYQISFGDIEPPIESDLEQQLSSRHYTSGDGSHDAPHDLKLLCLIEAEADQRSAADNFIVETSSPCYAGVGLCIDNIAANPRENERNDPSSRATVYPSIMFHKGNPALPVAGPEPRPAHADCGEAASVGSGFNQVYGGAYDSRQGVVGAPLEAGHVEDISSRESSEDREDYDEALADDEDDEGDRRHGVTRRHQPEEDERRRLSEKRRSRVASQSCGHKHQQGGQLNTFAAYRVGGPKPLHSSMLSSQEQMQLEHKFIEGHQRNFFERKQQKFHQLEHLKQMNSLQEQLLLMQLQQESQLQRFTSTSESGDLVGAISRCGNLVYRPPGQESGIVAAPDSNLWDPNLSDLDSNVKHTLAQYLDRLNQPNCRSSLLAPSHPLSPSTENNRTSSTGISDCLLKSLMESPRFGPRKVDGGGESSVRQSVSYDHQDAWVDQNGNNLSSSAVSAPRPQNSEFNRCVIATGCDNNDEEEKSLCKTFQSLGLERIWDSDAATSANDVYALARQQMLQAGSLYQFSDQFMHQPQQLSDSQQLQPRNNSGARVWPTALQSHAQLQQSDPGPASSSIVNPTLLRLSSGPSEPEKDFSCYKLAKLQLLSSAVCGDGPPQQTLQKQSAHHDQAIPASHSDGMELSVASVGPSASGPGGVQAVLHRSTQSNFSCVVPRKTNVQGQDYLKPTTFDNAPTSVEENLLTSPRTHFRPIKLHDETSVNGTLTTFTATSTHVPLSLPYQRSNSGTLYLENDAIDGSPKKYMIYKDPADKSIEHRPLYMPNQESSLVPKFKVVKNEKFCQTDGTNHDFVIGPSSDAASSSCRTPSPESDDDYDVFAFQKNDLASHGAFPRNDPPSHSAFKMNEQASRGAFLRNEQASHGSLKKNAPASHAALQRNDQVSVGASQKVDQAYRDQVSVGASQKVDQAYRDQVSVGASQKVDQAYRDQVSVGASQKVDQAYRDQVSVGASQKVDQAYRVQVSVGASQKVDQAYRGTFQKNAQASHAALQRNDQGSLGASQKVDQAYRGTFQKNDQSSHEASRNNHASHDPFQEIDRVSRGTFHNNDLASNDSSIRDCWTDHPMKGDGWKTLNLNNGSEWPTNSGDAEQSNRVRVSQPNERDNSDLRGFHAHQVKQRWNKTTEASPSKSFCRNLLGPVLDSDTPTNVAQLVGGGGRAHSGRTDRVIDTPAARAIWSSDPNTSVSGQQCHQAVIAAQHIDPAIKALWANSPDDQLKLAAAAAAVYNNDNNSRGAALPAWTMKSRVSGCIEQQIPSEWLAEQSILYTAEKNKQEERDGPGGGDQVSCGINFSEHLSNYYPRDEAWSSGDDCAPSNTDDLVRGIWSKPKRDSWNYNEGNWQEEALKKIESFENWSGEGGRNLNHNNKIWKKEGSGDWCNQDGRWHEGNISKWNEGEDGGYSQIRGDRLDGLHEYSEVRWSQTDAPSKQTPSGGGVWPVLSTKDHLDDLALLVEAQNWEKAVNLSASDCTMSGNNQQQPLSNKADPLLQEDLEELDPGWQLQEGFVWDPHTGNTPRKMPPQQQQLSGTETDDFDDTASQSSGGTSSSSEVVMMQTEDGGTLAVQVEYIDEELYDRIFGAPDLQMAGSLPDLPNNQAGLKVLRERWLPPWRRPCTFFMEGSCRRKHCKFSHDLSSITCRFWQDGSCLKGSECPFLHGYPVLPRRRNRSEGDSREGNRVGGGAAAGGQQGSVLSQQMRREGGKQRHRLSSFELTSETDFPSLGTAPDAKESERGGASGPAAGSGHQSSGGCQLSALSTPQQPQQIRKKTKYTRITAAILQASNADFGSSGNKGRRRRHTHSAHRSRTPDSHHHHHGSAALSTSAATAATGPPSLLSDNSFMANIGTLIIKPGTTLIGSASNGKNASSGACVLPVKAKVRRNRSKVKEPARTVMAGASVPSQAKDGGGRVHGDGTVSDY